MAKYSVQFRISGSKRKESRNVLTTRDEADAAKVTTEISQTLADEYRVRPDQVILLEVTPREMANAKPWRRPADAPKPADGVTLDEEYQGPTRKQLADMKKPDLVDLVIARGIEVDTSGNVEAIRAAVLKSLNPPRWTRLAVRAR